MISAPTLAEHIKRKRREESPKNSPEEEVLASTKDYKREGDTESILKNLDEVRSDLSANIERSEKELKIEFQKMKEEWKKIEEEGERRRRKSKNWREYLPT